MHTALRHCVYHISIRVHAWWMSKIADDGAKFNFTSLDVVIWCFGKLAPCCVSTALGRVAGFAMCVDSVIESCVWLRSWVIWLYLSCIWVVSLPSVCRFDSGVVDLLFVHWFILVTVCLSGLWLLHADTCMVCSRLLHYILVHNFYCTRAQSILSFPTYHVWLLASAVNIMLWPILHCITHIGLYSFTCISLGHLSIQ